MKLEALVQNFLFLDIITLINLRILNSICWFGKKSRNFCAQFIEAFSHSDFLANFRCVVPSMSRRKEITLMIDAPFDSWDPTIYASYVYTYNWPLRLRRNVFGIRINSFWPRPYHLSTRRYQVQVHTLASSHSNCTRQRPTGQEKQRANRDAPGPDSPKKSPLFSSLWRQHSKDSPDMFCA